MAVDVRVFGPARDHVGGADRVSVDVGLPATVSDLVAAMAALDAGLAELLPTCAVAVGDELVARDHVVRVGDEVALLPPVSGGC